VGVIQHVWPWYEQPQGAVEINRQHPLARGLTVAILPFSGARNLVSGQGNPQQYPKFVSGGRIGAGYSGVVSSESAALSADVSFVAAFETRSIGTGTRSVIGVGPTGGAQNNTNIGFHAIHVTDIYSGAIYCGTSYSIIGKPTGGTLQNNTRYVIGAGVAGAAGAIYSNGALVTSVASGLSARATTGRVALSTNSALADVLSDAALFEYYLQWNRRLSDAEQQMAATDEVWQLFAPRQIWVPYTAAPAIPTLSAPTFVPGSLSTTGWRGRVTAT